jgi:hypothetical protein
MLLSYVRIIYQVMAIIKSKYRQRLVGVEKKNENEIKIKAKFEQKGCWNSLLI